MKSDNKIGINRSSMVPLTRVICWSVFISVMSSCESFLEVDPPNSKVASELVFTNDITATSAVTGIYVDMYDYLSFASGSNQSIVSLSGLSADELIDFGGYDMNSIEFEENKLTSTNSYVLSLWTSMYKTIYHSNAVLEGLSSSSGLTPGTKNQLMGEALFVRAFTNFYLVNLFGDVPLITTTDYRANASVSRTAASEVYSKIVEDLLSANELLGDDYVTVDTDFVTKARVRPNKFAATALLARVYLYLRDWANAEIQATKVIDNTTTYSLVNDLNVVFQKNSMEAIWQLKPAAPGVDGIANEALYFGLYFLYYNVLNDQIISSFESGDSRQSSWVGAFDSGTGTVYYPFKYKQDTQTGAPIEYSMVLRLAEQYLIRAEARTQQGKLTEAIADVDIIRNRAGLSLIQDTDPGISEENLLSVVAHERQIELFTEWGHRWLDLKRTGLADATLAPIKDGWSSSDQLYPIPQSEINKNPKLGN